MGTTRHATLASDVQGLYPFRYSHGVELKSVEWLGTSQFASSPWRWGLRDPGIGRGWHRTPDTRRSSGTRFNSCTYLSRNHNDPQAGY